MRLLSRDKVLFVVDVDFWGLDEPEDTPFQAAVSHDRPPAIDGDRSALAPLIPLTAVRLLHNSQEQPGITRQMMGMLDGAATELLEGEAAARAFRFRVDDDIPWDDPESLYRLGIVDPGEEGLALIRGVPEVVAALSGPADQSFRTELHRGRDGMLWAKIEAPWRGPAFFAAFGLFALVEWTARHAPYNEITLPTAAGISALTHFYFEVLEEQGWEAVEVMLALQEVVATIATAPEPRAALEQFKQDAGG